jgi:hypothetical protein
VWRSLARFVEYGPVEMGLSTAVGNSAGTHIYNAEFNPIEQGYPGANL